MSEPVLGIDLGTTNSLVAVHLDAPEIFTSFEGERLFPSVVALTEKQELLVGDHAKRQAVLNPEGTINSVKRVIGRKFYTQEVQQAIRHMSVPLRANDDGDVVLSLGGTDFSPEEVSAIILRRLKEIAEHHLGHAVEKAVVTVPAYFNFSQRQATRNAGRMAHLDIIRVLSEPTAAAIAFGVGRGAENRVVAVYDLGGGTFDISIMEIKEGTFRVRGVSGDNQTGGDDFDRAIMEWMMEEWKKEHGSDLSQNRGALQRLREVAEFAKKELSGSTQTEVNVPFLASGPQGQPLHFNRALTRRQFDSLVEPLVDRTFEKCDDALRLARTKPYDITDVIMVGGQTRSPIVYEKVARYFNKLPLKGTNPDEAVALGAATLGAVLEGRDLGVSLQDVTGFSLGLEVDGGRALKLIPRNTPLPVQKTKMFTTFHDGQELVTVNVLQGESEYAAYNQSLVKFDLAPIPSAPAGTPDIEVEFSVDDSGIVSVTATDQKTGQAQGVQITDSNILSLREIREHAEKVSDLMDVESNRRDLTRYRNHAKYLAGRVNAFMLQQGEDLGEAAISQLSHGMTELERVSRFEDPKLLDAARKVVDREQAALGDQIHKAGISFELKGVEST